MKYNTYYIDFNGNIFKAQAKPDTTILPDSIEGTKILTAYEYAFRCGCKRYCRTNRN